MHLNTTMEYIQFWQLININIFQLSDISKNSDFGLINTNYQVLFSGIGNQVFCYLQMPTSQQ